MRHHRLPPQSRLPDQQPSLQAYPGTQPHRKALFWSASLILFDVAGEFDSGLNVFAWVPLSAPARRIISTVPRG
jgi:hypothetical protein